MKYIKTYEKVKSIFKNGDFVYCLDAINMERLSNGKIYKVDDVLIKSNNDVVIRLEELMNRYYNSKRFRLATTEEIEQYKLEKDANKYSL